MKFSLEKIYLNQNDQESPECSDKGSCYSFFSSFGSAFIVRLDALKYCKGGVKRDSSPASEYVYQKA